VTAGVPGLGAKVGTAIEMSAIRPGAWQDYAPPVFPLPHPSPRNNIWLKKNPRFAESLLPSLKVAVKAAMENVSNAQIVVDV
jgi:uracil-DNA glycosylase